MIGWQTHTYDPEGHDLLLVDHCHCAHLAESQMSKGPHQQIFRFHVYLNHLRVCLPEFPLIPRGGHSRDLTYMPALCLGYSLTQAHVQE